MTEAKDMIFIRQPEFNNNHEIEFYEEELEEDEFKEFEFQEQP